MAGVEIGRTSSNEVLTLGSTYPTILAAPRKQKKQLGKDLCEAAYEGDLELLRRLMDAGADANAADYDKRSAMHLASAEGHLAVVQFLVERQADINIRDRWGGYPLKEAVFNGHSEVRDFLIQKGARIDPKDEEALSQKQLGKDLCEAASEGDVELLRKLMDAGADANAADYDKRSAMHLASAEGHLAVVQFLVERQADINITDRWGRYPLKEAVFNGHSEVRDFLIQKGAQIDPKDEEALSQELCKASAKGDVDTVSKLVECHASVNGLMYHGRSALHLAAAEGHLSTVQLLLSKNANVHAKDRWGADALKDAMRGQHMAVAHVLRAHGASDDASSDPSSPLCEGGSTAGGEGESASPGERAHRERARPFQRERADNSSSDTQSIIARPRTRSRDGAEASSEINTSSCADQDTSRDTFTDDSQYDQRRGQRAQAWDELDTFGGPNALKSLCAQLDGAWSTDEDDEPPGRSIYVGSPMPPGLNSDVDTTSSALALSGILKEKREAKNSNDWNESRYAQDFIQLEKLGKGGFGSVFKARQRLDMREYAVKKVRLENDPKSPSNQRVIREVRSMATLSHHPNIVRYYGTWQESIIPEENDPHWGEASMSLDWTFGQSGTLGEETASEHVGPREPITLLYIQMELCTTSLRQILSNEAQLATEQLQQYLIDVTEGLTHVHSERYIHRDIKPDNIFIVNNVAKIGDFGLSVRSTGFGADGYEEEESVADESAQADSLNELTRGVGTHLYASPELDKGAMYDEKVDMYALGIVVFEMLHKFGTRMERIDVIGRLKAAMAMPQCQAPSPKTLPSRNPSGLDSSNSHSNYPLATGAVPPPLRLNASGATAAPAPAPAPAATTTAAATATISGAGAAISGAGAAGLGASGEGSSSHEALSYASTQPRQGRDWEEERRVALPVEMRELQAERRVEAELVMSLMALDPAARPSARSVRDTVLEQRPYDPQEEMRRKDSYIQELKAQLLRQSSGRGLSPHLDLGVPGVAGGASSN